MCCVQNRRSSGADVTEEQIFEHERFMPLVGWSSCIVLSMHSKYASSRQLAMPPVLVMTGFNVCRTGAAVGLM